VARATARTGTRRAGARTATRATASTGANRAGARTAARATACTWARGGPVHEKLGNRQHGTPK
jgi:hypothetical protein